MNGQERDRLDVIEGKLDLLIVKLEYAEKVSQDHESRLRSVEKWKLSIPISMLLVAATVIGGILKGVV